MPVERRPGVRGQVVALTQVRHDVGEHPDAHRQREGVPQAGAPRLQVRVAQAAEPRVVRREPIALIEEAERDDQRGERVGDGAVPPSR